MPQTVPMLVQSIPAAPIELKLSTSNQRRPNPTKIYVLRIRLWKIQRMRTTIRARLIQASQYQLNPKSRQHGDYYHTKHQILKPCTQQSSPRCTDIINNKAPFGHYLLPPSGLQCYHNGVLTVDTKPFEAVYINDQDVFLSLPPPCQCWRGGRWGC